MPKEIERKFLVGSDEWRNHVTASSDYLQGYVAVGEDRSVRVRLMDGKSARLTIKIGRNLLSRDEYEYEIPVVDAEELLQAAMGNVIEKTRHIVPYAGFTWEVDVFSGFYHGLIVAEVEMKDANDNPPLPVWLGREVTGDRRYSNQVMATEDLGAVLGHGLSNPAL